MREFVVKILGDVYTINACDRYHAASQGVRKYMKKHPSSMLTFTTLMYMVSARLVHPEISGRKPMYEEAL